MNYRSFILKFTIVVCIVAVVLFTVLTKLFETPNTNSNNRYINKSSILDLETKATFDTLVRTEQSYWLGTGPVPTNKIWSGVISTGKLEGLYTLPFGANVSEGKLRITIPNKNANERIVTAQAINNFIEILTVPNINSVFVKEYSDLTVKLSFQDINNTEIYEGIFIQGSPYIYIIPKVSKIILETENLTKQTKDGYWYYQYGENGVGIFTDGAVNESNGNLVIDFNEENYLTFGFTNAENFSLVKEYSQNIIEKVDTNFQINENVITISYEFTFLKGVNNKTVFGLLPHQYRKIEKANMLFQVNTIRGNQRFYEIDGRISYPIDRIPIPDGLVPSNFVEQDKTAIKTLLEKDIKETLYVRPSTYFGGNDILKLAKMMEIANLLGEKDLFESIKLKLKEELENWFNYEQNENGKYFAFDETWGGIIGYETSGFGGEKYNDHHFQYGYFIEAAYSLSKHDKEFYDDYKKFIDLLIRDIAEIDRTGLVFPYLRYFDHYEGHSWASGIGDFLDGNNQESTSEAINAWYSLALWANFTKDDELNNFAEYLYSAEINSTRHYWLNWYNNKDIFPDEYKRNKASLVWGGKFEYQTWFSMEPQSIEAIQYLPFTSSSLYLYSKNILTRDYNSFKQHLVNQSAHLNDFNYMYYSMLLGEELLDEKLVENMKIDVAQSRAFMYIWSSLWNRTDSLEISNNSGIPIYTLKLKNGNSTTFR